MDDLTALFNKIKSRTLAYLYKPSIFSLAAFLAGYRYAREEFGIPLTEKEKELGRFRQWLNEQYELGKNQMLERRIVLYSEDERDALNKFFKMYEIYQEKCLEEKEEKIAI